MLSLNYRRMFIRLSVYVDNYFEGRILTARNADSRIAERCCKLLLMDYEPSAHYRQMLDDYSRYLSSAMSEAKAEYRISKAKLLLRYMEENGKAGLEDLSIADLADFYAAAIASGESYTALKSYIDPGIFRPRRSFRHDKHEDAEKPWDTACIHSSGSEHDAALHRPGNG